MPRLPLLISIGFLVLFQCIHGNTSDSNKNDDTTLSLPDILTNDNNPDSSNNIKLKLNEKKELDQLGPIIINTDGTTSYINDWNKKTKKEQQQIMKIISKRNKLRKQKLLEKMNTTPKQEI